MSIAAQLQWPQLQRVQRLERKTAPPEPWICPDAVTMAEQAGLHLDEWQQQACLSTSLRLSLNCSRQSGKSTVASVLAVHTALSEENALCLLISPSLRQSAELFRSCLSLYRNLGRPVPARQESVTRVDLENGSRIISLPGTETTTRGFAKCRLLVVDEASRVEDGLYFAIRPFLAVSNGRLVTLSTPFGTRGWWYEAWKSNEAWERYRVTAEQCSRISKEFLEEEKATIGEWWWLQEYMCQFLDSVTAAFRSEDIERIIKPGVDQWQLV